MDKSLEEMEEKVTREELPCVSETILVVEDEEDVRRLAARVFESQGYIVLETSCGDDALVLSKERKEPIHMILTDYSEGYVDYGLELISSPEAGSFGISPVGSIVAPIGDRNLQLLECKSINS